MGYIRLGTTQAGSFPPWVPKDFIKTCQDNKQVIHWLGLLNDVVSPPLIATAILAPIGISMTTVSGLLSYFAGNGDLAGTLQEEAKKGADACKLLTVVVGLFGSGGSLATVAGAEAAPVLATAGGLYAALGIILDPLSKGQAPSGPTVIAFASAVWGLATFTKGGISSVGPVASPLTSSQAKQAMSASSAVIGAINKAPPSLKKKSTRPSNTSKQLTQSKSNAPNKYMVLGAGALVLYAAYSISNVIFDRN